MIIPLESLSSEILTNIIKEYVLQEGTDYGTETVSIEDKIQQVHQQLIQGSAVVVYSELHETVNILPAEQFKQQSV
ncbi:MAG: YheU family protein [Thalassotalea sp.]